MPVHGLHLGVELIVVVHQPLVRDVFVALEDGLHAEFHLVKSTGKFLAEGGVPCLDVEVGARQNA